MIDELRVSAREIIGSEFDEYNVSISSENCINILYLSGKTHHTLDEERVRTILNMNCKVDENGGIIFDELVQLACVMDNPLIKIGWDPISSEPEANDNGLPEKLCTFLTENKNLSSLFSAEIEVTDELGNEIKIERWTKKHKSKDNLN